MFRHKPAEQFFAEAGRRRVGIIGRVPLASGLLTGRITRDTTFAADDHRHFNRHGEMFDVGETFSGVPLGNALAAVEDLKPLVPPGATLTQFALRWTLMWDEVTCVIPGLRTVAQVRENLSAADLPPLSAETMAAVRGIYDARVRALVHARW
jgi:aryl-alcohol dehydrogenase-like predicted oxidoreductase